ncbi:MAG TPA: DUF4097 family beta strand repeat-containing protein [Blastocatellia bacterium]|nr:DUF4097 family beta strand repeat-containing protein [Blastocatellia bacterium]
MFENRYKSSKSLAKFLPALALGFMFLTASAASSNAQPFSRAFAVSPERSELEVVNQEGVIKVTAVANSSKIVINARQAAGAARIDATQDALGKVKVEVTGQGKVDFDITVPASSNIDLLSYRGAIMVTNLAGAVRARVTNGDIQIAGLRSAKVEAHCTQGNVIFSGDVLPSGRYILKSFSGRVEVTLPADADFNLSASSFRGGIDPDAFQMKFNKRSPHLVEASRGAGGASISLWTQEGSIHLRRKH